MAEAGTPEPRAQPIDVAAIASLTSAGEPDSTEMLRALLEQALHAAELANRQAVKLAEDFAETYAREQTLSRELEVKVRELQLTQRQATLYAEDLAQMVRQERARRRDLERALEQQRLQNEELRRTGLQGIGHLALAASAKDKATGAHLLRVRRYVEALAERLGLPPEKVDELGYSSVMHDVGKIHTPDHILQSSKKLTPEEFEVVKRHCENGAEILGEVKFFETARAIAREHHERWDGEGYPNGLRGDAISIAARIVSVADVFDALTSRRPYKDAWSVEEGMAAVVAGSGEQFDPSVVGAFQALYADGTVDRIRAEVADTAD